MKRSHSFKNWRGLVEDRGELIFLLEGCDNMLYAASRNRELIFGNWSLDANFGWFYDVPLRWNTRYRKFKEIK